MIPQEHEAPDFPDPEGEPAQPLPVFVNESSGATDWAEPLRMAAAMALLSSEWPRSWPGSCEVVTLWGAAGSMPDDAKHVAYQRYMGRVMLDKLPWLPCMLDMAGAALYVGPGTCAYQLQTSAELHTIPDLLTDTELLPWVTDVEQSKEAH